MAIQAKRLWTTGYSWSSNSDTERSSWVRNGLILGRKCNAARVHVFGFLLSGAQSYIHKLAGYTCLNMQNLQLPEGRPRIFNFQMVSNVFWHEIWPDFYSG